MSYKKRRPLNKHYDIHSEAYLTHKQAIELSKLHVDTKPIKKDLK